MRFKTSRKTLQVRGKGQALTTILILLFRGQLCKTMAMNSDRFLSLQA